MLDPNLPKLKKVDWNWSIDHRRHETDKIDKYGPSKSVPELNKNRPKTWYTSDWPTEIVISGVIKLTKTVHNWHMIDRIRQIIDRIRQIIDRIDRIRQIIDRIRQIIDRIRQIIDRIRQIIDKNWQNLTVDSRKESSKSKSLKSSTDIWNLVELKYFSHCA